MRSRSIWLRRASRSRELALLENPALPDAALQVPELAACGICLRRGVRSLGALPGRDGSIEAVEFIDGHGTARVDCDALLLSTGWMPAMQLALQAGATLQFDPGTGQHVPDRLPSGLFAAGRVNGVFDFDARIADG